MQHLALNHLKELLYSRTPLLGAGQRMKAAKALAAAEGGTVVEVLAEALWRSEDDAVKLLAAERIALASPGEEQDALCALWDRTRHPELEQPIREGQWEPTAPEALRVKCLLLWGGEHAFAGAGPEAVAPLLSAAADQHPATARAAHAALLHMNHPDAREALCQHVLQGDPQAAAIAREAGWKPADPGREAIFAYFTEDFTDFVRLDPNGVDLEAFWHDHPSARRRLADIARDCLRMEWASAMLRHPDKLDAEEWGVLVDLLAGKQSYRDLWLLARHQPPGRSVPLVQCLVDAGWRPAANTPDAELFLKLSRLLDRCVGDPLELADRRIQRTVFEGKPGQIARLAISPDWRFAAVGCDDEVVRVFGLPHAEAVATFEHPGGWASELAFSANGRFLAFCTTRDQTHVHRLPEGQQVAVLETEQVSCLAISRDGKLLVCNHGGRVDLWSLPEGRPLHSFRADEGPLHHLLLSPRGDLLATAGPDGVARVWSLPAGTPLQALDGHKDQLTTLAWSPDGHMLVTAAMDESLVVWRVDDGAELMRLEELPAVVKTLAVSPGGDLLAAGGRDNTLHLHRLSDGALVHTFADFHGSPAAVALNSMGQVLGCATEGKRTVKAFFPAFPRLDARLSAVRPEELAFAERLHRDPSLTREDRAWLGYWGNQVLAIREPVG